jgi:hypothetical protein
MTLSYSSLKAFIESPNHYLLYKEKKESSTQMRKGSLVDCLLFTPSDFPKKYVLADIDKRTKAGKEQAILFESQGLEVVSSEQMEEASKIVSSIEGNLNVQDLMIGLDYQKELRGKIQGIEFVGYSDAICPNYIIDLKTTKNASAKEFNRSIFNFKYHLQAAIYMHLSGANEYYWIAVESSAPYNCEVYSCSNEWKDKGFEMLYKGIEDFKKWDGEPQGYNQKVITLTPEKWM